LGVGVLVLLAALPACSGGAKSRTLSDGAGTADPVPSTGAIDDAGAPPPSECWGLEEGCRCADAGATVACKGPVFRAGDYISCAGTRQCVGGFWGPCWPQNYVTTTRK
jgi:hypothetical protein